jgi:hypothetical protein
VPDLTLTFDTLQQLTSARSACRRMLAAPLPLAAYQRAALSRTLAALDAFGDSAREVVLDADQKAALATALDRLQHHTVRSLTQPHVADPAIAAVAARLAHAAVWGLPDPQVVQFVRLGYGDKHGLSVRSLDFRINMPDRATLETCLIDAIAGYHHFTGTQVAAALGPMWDNLSTVTVGRDASLFIELAIPLNRQQQNGGDNTLSVPIPDAEREALADTICTAATSCRADAILSASTADPVRYAAARPAAPEQVASIRLYWD